MLQADGLCSWGEFGREHTNEPVVLFDPLTNHSLSIPLAQQRLMLPIGTEGQTSEPQRTLLPSPGAFIQCQSTGRQSSVPFV